MLGESGLNNKNMKELTILITTYNRRERLCNMLHSLEYQGLTNEYNLIICDNNSDYDVKSVIKDKFSKEFFDNIEFNSWNFNTGQSTNMAIAFLLVNTKWCWYLSDDDEVTEGSLKQVLNDIKAEPHVSAIKHSIDIFPDHPDGYLKNIEEYIDYYKNYDKGEMIFLSMVYNLDTLKPWLGMMTMYSYTYISFLIPVIKALTENIPIKLSSFNAYKYKVNDNNWSSKPETFLNTVLGIRTFQDIPLDIKSSTRKDLDRLICHHCNPSRLINCLFSIPKKSTRKRYFDNLKHYCFHTFIDHVVYGLSFYLFHYCNIDLRFIKRSFRNLMDR